MSESLLGKTFDIHGGGQDLQFPHHENEIAQNVGSCGCQPANYWLHTNMLLMNGKKMSKSDGNTISPEELFTGKSVHVTKGYSPMVVRFFMLQSHYRSPNDLTDEALQAAEKGFKRLMEANKNMQGLTGGNAINDAEKAISVANSIMNVNTNDGNPIIFNVHLGQPPFNESKFESSESKISDDEGKLLFKISSKVPETYREAARKHEFVTSEDSKGFVSNAGPETLIKFINLSMPCVFFGYCDYYEASYK